MRGATITFLFHYHHHLYFNPRAHEGRDELMRLCLMLKSYFNPRAHEGRDTKLSEMIDDSTHNFNPRAHEGRDQNLLEKK